MDKFLQDDKQQLEQIPVAHPQQQYGQIHVQLTSVNISGIEYQKLTTEIQTLRKENTDLRSQLYNYTALQKKCDLISTMNKGLQSSNAKLRNDVTFLTTQVKDLKKENGELKDDLAKKTDRITQLEKSVKCLEDNEKCRADMMICAEVCSLYEKTIVRRIFANNNDKSMQDRINFYDIVNNKIELSAEQTIIFNTIHNELCQYYTNGIHDVTYYLNRFKSPRHYESHDKYQDSNKSIHDIKICMNKYIKNSQIDRCDPKCHVEKCTDCDDTSNDFSSAIDIIAEQLKNDLSDHPFDTYAQLKQSQRPRRKH